jgi:hypothetical protein
MGFFSSIWGGSNPTLNQNIQKTGQLADWSSGQGESDTLASSDFMKAILSGDSSKISAVLGPQISNIRNSAQTQNKTTEEKGTRSGGTAALTAAENDKAHSDIASLIANLTGKSASSLGTMGENLFSQAGPLLKEQTDMSEKRQQNWANSIGGHVMISGVQSLEEAGESYLNHGQGTAAADTYGEGGAI